MHKAIVGIVASVILGAATAAQASVFTVTYELPGEVVTSTVFDISSIEDFNSRPLGVNGDFDAFEDLKPGFKGTYSNIRIMDRDVYGGASTDDGEKYGVAGLSGLAGSLSAYTLTFSEGINYFGYWLSALDSGNFVQFYDGDDLLFEFSPAYFQTLLQTDAIANASEYLGNPFIGGNTREYYAFLNFYALDDVLFDKIIFYQHIDNAGAGYESDNHTVGFYLEQGGTPIPPEQVPAPGAMMLLGLGILGLGLTRRRKA